MARKRMIDPDFWLDENLVGCSSWVRLFYVGLWNFADDYGVILDSAKVLKIQIFPFDDVEVSPFIDELVACGRLLPFEAEGKHWLHIKNFLKWQKVEKPSHKRNPTPPVDDSSPTPPHPVVSEVKRSKVKLSKENLVPSEQVAEVFDVFKKSVNPVINFGHKTQRKAAEELIVEFGFEAVKKLTEYAVSVQGQQYAPTITTPYQLREKLAALKIFHEKNQGATLRL